MSEDIGIILTMLALALTMAYLAHCECANLLAFREKYGPNVWLMGRYRGVDHWSAGAFGVMKAVQVIAFLFELVMLYLLIEYILYT